MKFAGQLRVGFAFVDVDTYAFLILLNQEIGESSDVLLLAGLVDVDEALLMIISLVVVREPRRLTNGSSWIGGFILQNRIRVGA